MYEIKCDKCGEVLFYNYQATIEACLGDSNYLKDTIKDIQERWLSNYLIYSCDFCKKTFKYTIIEVEKKVREGIARDVMSFRKLNMFKKEINPKTIDPDNGLEYCGQCDGVDRKGNCYVDIIKQCTIKI